MSLSKQVREREIDREYIREREREIRGIIEREGERGGRLTPLAADLECLS